MAETPLTPSLSPSDGERVADRPGEGIAFPTSFLRTVLKGRGSPDPQQARTRRTAQANSKVPVANGRATARESRAPALSEDAPSYRVAADVSPRQTSAAEKSAALSPTQPQFIDSFCGIGGLRIAVEKVGADACSLPTETRWKHLFNHGWTQMNADGIATKRHMGRNAPAFEL